MELKEPVKRGQEVCTSPPAHPTHLDQDDGKNGKMRSTMIWVWIGLDWIGWMDGWMDGAPFEEADKQRPTGTQTPPSSCTYINFEHVL